MPSRASASNTPWRPPDIRETIFQGHLGKTVRAAIKAEAPGVLSGLAQIEASCRQLGLTIASGLAAGDSFEAGKYLLHLEGNPVQIVKAEDVLLGTVSKASGIASAARRALDEAGGRFRVVCGAAKKMPHALRETVRQAVMDGGAMVRMLQGPFVYLDKNYLRILGGVKQSLENVAGLGRPVVIQIKGESGPVAQEALWAAQGGAAVVMVDTGRIEDLRSVSAALGQAGQRSSLEIAFAGDLALEDLAALAGEDLDAVDIGYAIVDAPAVPMRFDVLAPGAPG